MVLGGKTVLDFWFQHCETARLVVEPIFALVFCLPIRDKADEKVVIRQCWIDMVWNEGSGMDAVLCNNEWCRLLDFCASGEKSTYLHFITHFWRLGNWGAENCVKLWHQHMRSILESDDWNVVWYTTRPRLGGTFTLIFRHPKIRSSKVNQKQLVKSQKSCRKSTTSLFHSHPSTKSYCKPNYNMNTGIVSWKKV